MKKIIDLIKSLLFGGGSIAEKIEEVKELDTVVKEEVKVVEQKVEEVKTKVKKATAKKPTQKKAGKKIDK